MEWTDIAAEVRQGTRRDAILYSVGANATHGLRRTNADKRRAVETLLRDEEWSQWSNREIARQCGVSLNLVNSMRKDLSELKVQIGAERTVERNGKTYSLNTANIASSNSRRAKKTKNDNSKAEELQDIVERLHQKDTTLPPIPYQVGSVVEIRAGCNPTLRKHDGMWGIITHVGNFSCTVHISVRNVNVRCKPDEMDLVDPKYTADIRAVHQRITALMQRDDLSRTAIAVVETLVRQTCFSPGDLWLLEKIEEWHGL